MNAPIRSPVARVSHPISASSRSTPAMISSMTTATTRRSTSPMQPVAPAFSPSRRPSVSVPLARCDLSGLHTRYIHAGELETLITLIASVNPRCIIEFGTNSGRTAAALLRNIPSIERYLGVDVPQGYVPEKQVQHREVPE